MRAGEVVYAIFGAGVGYRLGQEYDAWKAMLYALLWPAWIGYHVASWILR